MFKMTVVRLVLSSMIFTGTLAAHAQKPAYQIDVDWAATNTDAGGSVDCPAQYISLGVEYAIASNGRAAVVNEAIFAAYRGDVNRSFQLVMLTQCHNPDARQQLVDAGPSLVIPYLVENWTPNGLDPQTVKDGVQTVITIFAAAS
jgi:hypothetical protein